jgi:mono/diheme cytochrome c family protein
LQGPLAAACVIGAIVVAGDRATARLVAQATTAPAKKAAVIAAPAKTPATFGIGRPATPAEIAALDIDIGPDGAGLPPGRGTAADGAPIYAARCAGCHGKTGREGPNDVLVGRLPGDAFPFARDPRAPKTIGSYWPYATTVFDYIRRAMPPDTPGSLKDEEVYGLVAYLLAMNELIPQDAVVDAASLPKVQMPARAHFVPDARGQPKAAAPLVHKERKER